MLQLVSQAASVAGTSQTHSQQPGKQSLGPPPLTSRRHVTVLEERSNTRQQLISVLILIRSTQRSSDIPLTSVLKVTRLLEMSKTRCCPASNRNSNTNGLVLKWLGDSLCKAIFLFYIRNVQIKEKSEKDSSDTPPCHPRRKLALRSQPSPTSPRPARWSLLQPPHNGPGSLGPVPSDLGVGA